MNNEFVQIDPTTGASTVIGGSGFFSNLSGLDWNVETLRMTDVFDGGDWNLAEISPGAGGAELIGHQTNSFDVPALVTVDGTLWAFDFDDNNDSALLAILVERTMPTPFATRQANLQAGLLSVANLSNDLTADLLNGGAVADWEIEP